jgi:hypothetical protein
VWGLGLRHEILNIAGAEPLFSVEGGILKAEPSSGQLLDDQP